jgi:amino acid adenylation domain-containing protein
MTLPPEQEAIRGKCFHPSGTFVEFPEGEIELSIPARFEKIAATFPDRLALKSKNRALTYRQLNEAANRVAAAILALRGKKSEAVALMFEQGAAAMSAILGVVKSGKFYVPMDPSAPSKRCRAILKHSTAGLLVTNTQNLAKAELAEADGCKIINVDDLGDRPAAENPNLSLSADAFAYLVYTSGSTGEPKGIVQTHRYALYHVFEYVNSFRICPDDRLSLVFPWLFNGGIHIIHSTLLSGAALFPVDVKTDGLNHLARLLVEEKITIYHSTATTLRQTLNLLDRDEKLQNLRLVRFGGDSVSAADIQLYKENFSADCLLLNSFATSEAGAICRYFFDKSTQAGNDPVPAGYPAHGKEILLLDDQGQEVGCNQIGEIAVRSRYLSTGYWQDPSLTAAKFIADPSKPKERMYLTGDLGRMTPDGCLYHLGRKDFQVKIRGYRVEVAEVETALRQHEKIKEVAVVGRSDPSGNSRLVAYVVPAVKIETSASTLRQFLSHKLPDYMIPTSFVFLECLPVTPNGKINRRLLPEPGRSRPDLATPVASPRNDIERELVRVWADVLALDMVGIGDNFFDLGGDSLSASRIIARVFERFQLDIPMTQLFNAPTIADMATVITAHQDKTLSEQALAALLNELESLSEVEAARILAEQQKNSKV